MYTSRVKEEERGEGEERREMVEEENGRKLREEGVVWR